MCCFVITNCSEICSGTRQRPGSERPAGPHLHHPDESSWAAVPLPQGTGPCTCAQGCCLRGQEAQWRGAAGHGKVIGPHFADERTDSRQCRDKPPQGQGQGAEGSLGLGIRWTWAPVLMPSLSGGHIIRHACLRSAGQAGLRVSSGAQGEPVQSSHGPGATTSDSVLRLWANA